MNVSLDAITGICENSHFLKPFGCGLEDIFNTKYVHKTECWCGCGGFGVRQWVSDRLSVKLHCITGEFINAKYNTVDFIKVELNYTIMKSAIVIKSTTINSTPMNSSEMNFSKMNFSEIHSNKLYPNELHPK